MKKLLIISLFLFSAAVNAQQLISSAAKVAQGISWTVGEMVTETIVGGGICAIQGFNHPTEVIPTVSIDVETAQPALNIRVYPNPVTDLLKVDCVEGDSYTWNIANLLGQKVLSGQSSEASSAIHTGSLAPANYLLTVSSNQGVKSVIIIKK